MCPGITLKWESCWNADSDSIGLGWDLGLFISNKLLGERTAAGSWTIIWIAKWETLVMVLFWVKLKVWGVFSAQEWCNLVCHFEVSSAHCVENPRRKWRRERRDQPGGCCSSLGEIFWCLLLGWWWWQWGEKCRPAQLCSLCTAQGTNRVGMLSWQSSYIPFANLFILRFTSWEGDISFTIPPPQKEMGTFL